MLCTDIGVLGRAISGLTTFETVTVTAITTPPKLKKEEDNYRSHPRVFRGRNKQTYEIFQGIWEDTLGPAKFYDSPGQEGRYLEFRPRAHLV